MRPITIAWLSRDLRLADNPALYHAAQRGRVLPVFIWAPEEETPWKPGAARQWWLHHALASLERTLAQCHQRLIVRKGASLDHLQALIAQTGANAVYWNTRYEPMLRTRDAHIASTLREQGIMVETFPSYLLHDPDVIRTGGGTPYRVYTPFWRKLKSTLHVPEPLPKPAFASTLPIDEWPESEPLAALKLLPRINWDSNFYQTWIPGEAAAHDRLQHFLKSSVQIYNTERNRPDHEGTSRLSPYLHHGELSPRQIWHAVNAWMKQHGDKPDAEVYLKEIAWREFSYHLLYHYPHTPLEALNAKFSAFPWQHDAESLKRWQYGQTGYPIVDAGMRQLWHTGWMHNRVRMIVASFLTKDLLIWWQDGAKWFWDTLVDADLASNTMGWQWSAGSGADAQPFFRIFNPISQGERYDPNGDYVRKWVPELQKVPNKYIHKPWDAPTSILQQAGIRLGKTYPKPMVDHSKARDLALDAYQTIRKS